MLVCMHACLCVCVCVCVFVCMCVTNVCKNISIISISSIPQTEKMAYVSMIVCVHVIVCVCVANGCTCMFDSLGSEGVNNSILY